MNYYRFCNYLIILSFMLTIIPILLSYDIRDEIIELIEDMDSQIVVDTSVYKTNLPQVITRVGDVLFSFNILIYQIY